MSGYRIDNTDGINGTVEISRHFSVVRDDGTKIGNVIETIRVVPDDPASVVYMAFPVRAPGAEIVMLTGAVTFAAACALLDPNGKATAAESVKP